MLVDLNKFLFNLKNTLNKNIKNIPLNIDKEFENQSVF